MFEELQNKKWLIGVSGGPDSMALLDMAYKAGLSVEVAHVNYHKRESADRDMLITKHYCQSHHIPCHILNEAYDVKGNFQSFARTYRYEFYRTMCDTNDLDGVLVAHQMDDVIETYIMQKDKNLECDHYGLQKEIILYGVKVIRPILDLTKADCLAYCQKHHIEYGIDESNLTNHYTRNRIRHNVIDKMSHEDKLKMINEIDEENKAIEENIKPFKDISNPFSLDWYRSLKNEQRMIFLRYFMNKHLSLHLSKGQCCEYDKALMGQKNCLIPVDGYYINKSYGLCEVVGNCTHSYSYKLESLYAFETEFFKVVLNGGNNFNGVTVKEEDFPLTIRNAKEEDKIKMRYGYKRLSRFFIDKKIDLYSRKVWPVVVNCKNEIILVPQIGCNVNHWSIKHNLFVIK